MARRKRRPPSIDDVARKAGVSIATVSNVLHGKTHLFSPGTEKRVQAAIEGLGYRGNPIARSLARRRAQTLGFVAARHRGMIVADYFYSHVLDGFLERVLDADYQVKLVTLGMYDPPTRAEQLIEDGSLDGALLVSPAADGCLHGWVRQSEFPAVIVGGFPPQVTCPCVGMDDTVCMREAVQWLIGLGHRAIGYIGGPQRSWSARERRAGYHAALREAGIGPCDAWEREGDYESDSGSRCALEILAGARRPTVILCANDFMALGALHALRFKGVRVPEDISLMGFDDIDAGRLSHPPLTTLHQPIREIGQTAATLLLEQVETGKREAASVRLRGDIVERASVARRERGQPE
ncbi:MAG: LacI family DNA-binding transcriptional regulator [Kiritimatiellae bacterium]|nr:LacI family DNA-binding transcriptional regulator [Kiritimatiellia bacterium]